MNIKEIKFLSEQLDAIFDRINDGITDSDTSLTCLKKLETIARCAKNTAEASETDAEERIVKHPAMIKRVEEFHAAYASRKEIK